MFTSRIQLFLHIHQLTQALKLFFFILLCFLSCKSAEIKKSRQEYTNPHAVIDSQNIFGKMQSLIIYNREQEIVKGARVLVNDIPLIYSADQNGWIWTGPDSSYYKIEVSAKGYQLLQYEGLLQIPVTLWLLRDNEVFIWNGLIKQPCIHQPDEWMFELSRDGLQHLTKEFLRGKLISFPEKFGDQWLQPIQLYYGSEQEFYDTEKANIGIWVVRESEKNTNESVRIKSEEIKFVGPAIFFRIDNPPFSIQSFIEVKLGPNFNFEQNWALLIALPLQKKPKPEQWLPGNYFSVVAADYTLSGINKLVSDLRKINGIEFANPQYWMTTK